MRLDEGQTEAVDDDVAEILRRKTPAERIRIGFDMWASASAMLTARLKVSHPDWSPSEARKEVARRLSHGAI